MVEKLMELPAALHNKLVDFITELPHIDDSKTQRALIYSAGIDRYLQKQIVFGGSALQFAQEVVVTLSQYGKLKDGRPALSSILEATKAYIGKDRREYCESLLKELSEYDSSYKNAPVSDNVEPYNQQQHSHYFDDITIPVLLVLIVFIGSVIGVFYFSKDVLFPLIEAYSKDFGLFFIYSGFVGISMVSALVIFGILRSSGILKKKSKENQYEFGGAMTCFLVVLIFLIGSYTHYTSQFTILELIGNVRFVQHDEPTEVIEGAKIALSQFIGFETITDKNGNFRLQIPDNKAIHEIELQVSYGGTTIFRTVRKPEFNNIRVNITKEKLYK